ADLGVCEGWVGRSWPPGRERGASWRRGGALPARAWGDPAGAGWSRSGRYPTADLGAWGGWGVAPGPPGPGGGAGGGGLWRWRAYGPPVGQQGGLEPFTRSVDGGPGQLGRLGRPARAPWTGEGALVPGGWGLCPGAGGGRGRRGRRFHRNLPRWAHEGRGGG